jgi:hypothetical protein
MNRNLDKEAYNAGEEKGYTDYPTYQEIIIIPPKNDVHSSALILAGQLSIFYFLRCVYLL